MATATVAPARGICARCGEIVYRHGSRELSAVRVAGGLFELRDGHFTRRALADMSAEYAARRRIHGGGYDLHECPDMEHWSAR